MVSDATTDYECECMVINFYVVHNSVDTQCVQSFELAKNRERYEPENIESVR